MRAALLAIACLVAAGCATPDGGPPTSPTPSATGTPTATTPGTTPSATPATTPATTTPTPPRPFVEPTFDGGRALELVRAQVLDETGEVRYRVPGTEGNEEVAQLIDDTMAALGFDVRWDEFVARYGCVNTPMHNVIAERAGTSGRVVVFAAHYDTRPIADKDPDASRRDEPIAGANDGASGVAVLMELARVLPPTNDTVRFVFFDGEDGGGYGGSACTDWILGSTHYAATLSDAELDAIDAFVLVDMVGDTRLELPWEMHSRNGAGRGLQDRIYGVAHGLGHMQFKNETGYAILDDHKPFVDEGVPAVDLIHLVEGTFFPDTHHTVSDDLEHVSAESLAAVGRTLETWFRER